jgi:DNA gyrase subunit A
MDLVIVSEKGMVKRSKLDAYRTQGRGGVGVAALALQAGDALAGAVVADPEADLIILTARGNSIRISGKTVRASGRVTSGVRGIRLRDGDRVVALAAAK